jgi:hypothetical protein
MTVERNFLLSKHAQLRARQRGTSSRDLQFILEHGEADQEVGSGCMEVSLKREQLSELRAAGIDTGQLERLARLRVILAEDGTIVTTMKVQGFTRRSRRQRRTCRQRAVNSMLYGRGHRSADRSSR